MAQLPESILANLPENALLDDRTAAIVREQTAVTIKPKGNKQAILRLSDIDSNWDAWVMPVAKGMTIDLIGQKHEKVTREWKSSPLYAAYSDTINNTVLKQKNISITAAMCLGLKSITSGYPFRLPVATDRSFDQLVAFESWIWQLKQKHDIKDIYFKDPGFNELDKQFLTSKGYKIPHTPEPDDHLSESTFLFMPGTDVHVEWSSLATTFPVMLITNEIGDFGLCHRWKLNWDLPPKERYAECENAQNNTLAAWERVEHRKMLHSFLTQRASRSLLEPENTSEYVSWGFGFWLYYKPDSKADIGDSKLDEETEKVYKRAEAVM